MHTEAAQGARKARRTGSRQPLGRGGILIASEAMNVVVKKQGDELAQIKAKRKALLAAVATTRRDMVKMRNTQKKLKKELCREIRVKAKARAKRLGIPV